MYVILTSKPGQFHSKAGEGIEPVEAWSYLFCGRQRARFVIARITGQPRVTIVDETPPCVVNHVPAKFLERFDSIERARRELEQLVRGAEFRLEPSTRLD